MVMYAKYLDVIAHETSDAAQMMERVADLAKNHKVTGRDKKAEKRKKNMAEISIVIISANNESMGIITYINK